MNGRRLVKHPRCAPSATALIVLVIGLHVAIPLAHAETTPTPDDSATVMPMTVDEDAALREQIERNWNLGSMAGSPELSGLIVELRVTLQPDGTVTKIDVLNGDPDNDTLRAAAQSAMRAVMISSPLKLPPGKSFSSIRLRFYPDQAVQ